MDEISKPLTAFTTHNAVYQWKTMPFGLAGASGTFQKRNESYFKISFRELEQSSRLLTVAIIVCSVCEFSVSRFVNFLFLKSEMVKSATRGKFYSLGGACKELLPASGNRSDKRRDREEDLATTEGKRSKRKREEGEKKKPGS
ncbi:hypothetical protein TNCV_4203681 [Trichonephila clavipes]|nr:hypothetical protein TNCV_4203681 [Trichonephila clavipes]